MCSITFSLNSQEELELQAKEYYDLLILWKSYPDMPGLSELLSAAESRLGINQVKIDQYCINQSQLLYEDALKIWQLETKTEIQVLQAMDLVTESICLNPDNIPAIKLKDVMLFEKGGNRPIIMSSGLRGLYERAMKEYMDGDLYKSFSTIRELSNNEAIENNPDFIKLKALVYKKYYDSLKGF